MNRIKRLSMSVLKDNKDKFGINFDENKEILNNLSIIRSKILKNEIAGYITRLIKNELRIKVEKTNSVEKEEQLSEDVEATNDEPKDDVVVEESFTKSELQD